MKSTVFITGAYGQLGNAIVKLLKESFNIIATDIVLPENYSVDSAILDVTDLQSVEDLIKKWEPKILINLAALTDVNKCQEKPELAHAVNVQGVSNLLKSFSGKIIQISTDYVFDGINGPFAETDITNPINVYGRTNLAAEEAIVASENPWVILRTNVLFDFYGSTKASFFNWVISSLQQNEVIHVVNDQWNNPIWAYDMAGIIQQILARNFSGVYHCGGDQYLTRFNFAKLIATEFGLDVSLIKPISTQELNQIAPRPLKGGLKTDKLISDLENGTVSLIESIRKIKHKVTL
jgi:dTDP-4-dehydrorhamnose reductase